MNPAVCTSRGSRGPGGREGGPRLREASAPATAAWEVAKALTAPDRCTSVLPPVPRPAGAPGHSEALHELVELLGIAREFVSRGRDLLRGGCVICSTRPTMSSTACPIVRNASRVCATTAVPLAVLRAPSSTTVTACDVSLWIDPISSEISDAADWDSSASLRTSLADRRGTPGSIRRGYGSAGGVGSATDVGESGFDDDIAVFGDGLIGERTVAGVPAGSW